MTSNTTKPRSAEVRPRGTGTPVLDLVHDARRQVVVLNESPVIVGRGDDADIVLDNDGLSRRHAKFIVTRDKQVSVVDLESTNGSFVNGVKIEMVRLSERDEIQLGPDVVARLRFVPAGQDPRGPLARLTDRQLHVACLVADGLTSAEVAELLGLSARTVESHLARIYSRVEVRGRAELTRLITESGLPRLRASEAVKLR